MPGQAVLSDKDVNAAVSQQQPQQKGDVKSMEYHRQVLQSKIEEEKKNTQYISPSDNIMSPCTAKLNQLRNKQVGKAKGKCLFAQASARKFDAAAAPSAAAGGNVLGAKNAQGGI